MGISLEKYLEDDELQHEELLDEEDDDGEEEEDDEEEDDDEEDEEDTIQRHSISSAGVEQPSALTRGPEQLSSACKGVKGGWLHVVWERQGKKR